MKIIEEYKSKNRGSSTVYDKAKKLLPSGNTRSALYWRPFPLCMRKGKGSYIWDVDGNKRVDFNYNNTTLILGHNNPEVIKAAEEQLSQGTVLGAATETELRLAEEILERLKGSDRIRFTPTGTEANMQALRLARAISGKPLIAKALGGYHGSWDGVPLTPDTVGIPNGVKNSTIYFPYNDSESAEMIIKQNREELAAVVIEPTMREMTPKPGFLETLRETTETYDILLVFDEVISFRLSPGGAQELYGIKPDITAMGKIIGGGFPVGAYAISSKCMSPLMIPSTILPETTSALLGFSGTFNAFPIAMAAGHAVMKEMTKKKYNMIASMGEDMRKGLRMVFREEGLNIYVGGTGSFFFIAWSDKGVYDHVSSTIADKGLFNLFNIGMMNKGFYILGHPNVSTVQKKENIKAALTAARETVREMKPIIKKRAPHLIS
jgi:glutamate-1-semialdehyde 2,1-aminomutase